jgi:hypothetical protein
MKRFKVLGLCLVAVFALGAVVVSNAAAEPPEYFTCLKASPTNTGNYTEKLCKALAGTPGTAKYEREAWNKGKKVTFKGKNEGTPHNNSVNPFGENMVAGEPGQIEGSLECTKEKVVGAVTGPQGAEWQTEYSSCEAAGVKCKTHGLKEGHIKTEKLSSELVFLDAAKTKAGIEISGHGKVGGPESSDGEIAQYECGAGATAENVEVFGKLLVPVEGNAEEAQKHTKLLAAEDATTHLQEYTYVEEAPYGAASGESAKSWWEYEESQKACQAGLAPYPPGTHTRVECELLLGGANPIAVQPVMLESYATGAKPDDVPGVQIGVTLVKGEAIGITTGVKEPAKAFEVTDKVHLASGKMWSAFGSPPKWWVAGAPLAAPEALAEETTLTKPFKLEFALTAGEKSGSVAISCTKEKIKNGVIEGTGTRTEEAEVYEGCEVVGQPQCSVGSLGTPGTITTNALKATLEAGTPEKLKFLPEDGKPIAAFEIEETSPSCAESGFVYRANGEMICNYKEVESEELEHPLEFIAGESKVTVEGTET